MELLSQVAKIQTFCQMLNFEQRIVIFYKIGSNMAYVFCQSVAALSPFSVLLFRMQPVWCCLIGPTELGAL